MLIGYARVSTQDQNPQLQIDALEAAGCEKIFIEKASGAQRERPELQAVLDYARDGDTICVWKLDRLARSIKQLIETVEGMETCGVGFHSLTENIDTTTTGGRLVFHIFGALAEFERSMIRERTKAGLEAAKRGGKLSGRPKSLSDEDLDVAHTLLASNTLTVAEIAKRLKVSPATLYRYIPAARHSTLETAG